MWQVKKTKHARLKLAKTRGRDKYDGDAFLIDHYAAEACHMTTRIGTLTSCGCR